VRILRELLLLLAIMALVGGGVFAMWHWWPKHRATANTASNQDNIIETRTEARIRDLLRREVSADALRDPPVLEAVRRIQDRLGPATAKTSQPIEIYIIDSPTINAVCLPGGLIVVYSGLIRRMASPEELAAVIAHEIAHAVHHDSMHALERELGMAALLTLAGGRSDALTTRLLRRLISSGFSRQQEQDADKEATRTLAAADIDPVALADSLRHMRQDDAGDSAVLQYVSTHPDIDSRIKTAEAVSAAWKGKPRPIEVDWKQFRSQFHLLH
jgi:predicted Zn-dependent protease